MRNFKLLCASLFLLLNSQTLQAWRIEGDTVIVIEDGDYLWKIAHNLYGRGFDYPKIWNNKLDPGLSSNPSNVYDGMRFRLNKPLNSSHDAPQPPKADSSSNEPPTPTATTSDPKTIQNVVNYYGSSNEPDKSNLSFGCQLLLNIVTSFFDVFFFPFILLLVTKFLLRGEDEKKRKFYLQLLIILLAGLILHTLVDNIGSFFSTRETIVERSGGGYLWPVLAAAATMIMILAATFFIKKYIFNDAISKNKPPSNKANEFTRKSTYIEICENISALKGVVDLMGANTSNQQQPTNYSKDFNTITDKIESLLHAQAAMYMRTIHINTAITKLTSLNNQVAAWNGTTKTNNILSNIKSLQLFIANELRK